MAESNSGTSLSISHLIFIPAVITLAITLLRLAGELERWNQHLFGRAAGGGGAIVGISWLPFIFGPYFAVKLARSGDPAKSVAKTIIFAFLGVILGIGGAVLSEAPKITFPGKEIVGLMVTVVGALTIIPFWPRLFKALIAYALAARIPVLVVMYFAMRGQWGTHYDALALGFTASTPFGTKFLYLAFIPQMTFWMAYTVAVGAFIGGIFAAIMVRKRQQAPAAS
jgi:hypothetical protein